MRAVILALCFALLPVLAHAKEKIRAFEIPRTAVYEIQSKKLGRTYPAYVKLPGGYDDPKNAGRTYPVLYLTDGQVRFEIASAVTESPMLNGDIQPFIIVAIGQAKGEEWRVSRTRDYTPMNVGGPLASGGAPAFLQFLREEFIPFIEARYRVDQARRAYAGSSYGGTFGAYVLFAAPDTFRSYILSAPWFGDEGGMIFKMEKDYAASHKDLPADVFVAVGEWDAPSMVAYPAQLQSALDGRKYPGLRLKRDYVVQATHNTAFPIILERAVEWLFPKEMPK
jgi:predicted alpha/beta superfamily hydrolase